ncbi:MAG: hypothetical protein Q8S31_08530 [Alphaproteobacteria bacterium]|nr:hypothetical protein [Alphaproteobacteria bacterium]
MFIKKLFHFSLIILLLIDINFSVYAANSKDEETNKHLAALEINPDETPEEKAEKIFKMSLLLDLFAVKDLYFKGFIEEAEELLYMNSIGYKMVLGYNPNHPLAQLFFDAHRHPGDSGFSVEGDPKSMVAISGLYTDGIEDDVPDDWSMQAFWFARSAQKTALAQDGKKLLEDRQKGAWVTFSAKELGSLLAFEGTGIAGGFAAGQALQQMLNQSYWIYIGLGIGAAGGALTWFASSQLYNMYQKYKEKRRSKKNLNELKEAEDDDEFEDIVAMEEGRSKSSKKSKNSKQPSVENSSIDIAQTLNIHESSSFEKLSKYQTLSPKEKKKLDDKFLIHLYGTSEDDQKFVTLYRKITKHERISTKNDELQKRSPRKETTHEEGRLKRWSKALLHRLSTFNPWGHNPTPIEEDNIDHKKQHENVIDDDSLDTKPHAQSMPNMPFHNEDFVEIEMNHVAIDEYTLHLDEENIKKAQKIFKIVLNLDNFAIKKLHFQGYTKEAEKLMYMIAIGYKMVVGYDAHHPYAQIFFEAHDHPNEEGFMVPGDQTAQKAISGLFSDDIEDEVPDDRQVEAYWIGRSLLEPGQSTKPTNTQKEDKTASFLSFTAKEFGALCAAEAAGLVAGYALGDILMQSFGAYYWTYIGLGIGGAGGFLTWLGGLKIPEIYKWCSTKFQHKEDLDQINNAFDDIEIDKDQAKIITMDDEEVEEPQEESLPKLKSEIKTPPDDLIEQDEKLFVPTTTNEEDEIQNKSANIDESPVIELTILPSDDTQQLKDESEIEEVGPPPPPMTSTNLSTSKKPANLNSSQLKTPSQKSIQIPKKMSQKEEDALHEKFLQRLFTHGADDLFVRRYLELTKDKRVEATHIAKSKCDEAKEKEASHKKRMQHYLTRQASRLNIFRHSDDEDDEDDRRLHRSKSRHEKKSYESQNPYGSTSSTFREYNEEDQHFDDYRDQYDGFDPYDDPFQANPRNFGKPNDQYDEDDL